MANVGKVVTVTIDASDTLLDPGLISTIPGSHIVFVVVNNGTSKHRVSIVPSEFRKKKNADKDDPLDPFSVFWADVEKNDVGAIVHQIRPQSHFGAPINHKHEYKYDIHWSNKTLDPDIQINN